MDRDGTGSYHRLDILWFCLITNSQIKLEMYSCRDPNIMLDTPNATGRRQWPIQRQERRHIHGGRTKDYSNVQDIIFIIWKTVCVCVRAVKRLSRPSTPTPPPSPTVTKPALTEEEVEKKSTAIIEEYVHINDLKVRTHTCVCVETHTDMETHTHGDTHRHGYTHTQTWRP